MNKLFKLFLGFFLLLFLGIIGVVGFLKPSKDSSFLLTYDLIILIIVFLILLLTILTIVLTKRKIVVAALLITLLLVLSFFAYMTLQESNKEQTKPDEILANSKNEKEVKTKKTIKLSNSHKTKINCIESSYNETIKDLALDTLSILEQDFQNIFGKCILENDYVEIKFSRENVLYKESLPVVEIKNFGILMDSLKTGFNGLDTNTVRFIKNDSIASYNLTFRDGSKTELTWSTKDHWGFYEFISYLIDYDCFLFHQVDHGYGEVLISLKDGVKLHFVPTFSPEKNRFFMINSEFGYADEYFISLKVGESPFAPEININTSYFPSFENGKHARIGVNNPIWLNDTEFAFEFYKLMRYSSQTRNDTLYYDKINVIGKIKSSR